MAIQPRLGSGGGSLAAMIGLGRASGDHGIAPLGQGVRDQEFQFAGFIAPQGKTGLVIALDQQSGAAETDRELSQFMQRGRKKAERIFREGGEHHD